VAGRTIRFGCPGPRADLAGLPGVTAVGGDDQRAELTTADAEATLRALLAGPRSLPDLEVAGATLEQAFLHLIDPSGATR
jgi:ABC-2 type transport system ATP-binding protein